MNNRFLFIFISATASALVIAGIFFYPDLINAPSFSFGADSVDAISITEEEVPVFEKEKSVASMLVVGDIMLDRTVFEHTKKAKDFNHPFLLIDPLFQKPYDLRVANLEGPVTNFKSVALTSRFTFTFNPDFVGPLKKRFEVLSLANNHTTNFGQKGLDQTRKRLQDGGIMFFGDPNNTAGFISTTTSVNGITFGFVGHHQLIEKGFDRIIADIKKLDKEVDVVIVLPHWGHEYKTDKPSGLQKKEALAMVDAGADIIFGAHPHVIQPIEVYKGKFIFYSFGNFIFDQYFSRETSEGLAIKAMFTKEDGIVTPQFELIPLSINKLSQPYVAVEADKKRILEHLRKTFIGNKTVQALVPSGIVYLP